MIESFSVLAVTKTILIVVTSNVLASIALRSWVFTLKPIHKYAVFATTSAVLLLVAGAKLLARNYVYVPPALLLVLVVGIAGIGIARFVRRPPWPPRG